MEAKKQTHFLPILWSKINLVRAKAIIVLEPLVLVQIILLPAKLLEEAIIFAKQLFADELEVLEEGLTVPEELEEL